MMAILIVLGLFMDWVGIVLLIIPVFLPIVRRLPIEEIGLIGGIEVDHDLQRHERTEMLLQPAIVADDPTVRTEAVLQPHG